MKKHINILLVEDSIFDQFLILEKLEKLKNYTCSVTIVKYLKWAKEWLEKVVYDLIVLDLGLPDSKGLQTILSIKDICQTKLLIFTGATMEEKLLQDHGIKGFISKNKLSEKDSEELVDYQLELAMETTNLQKTQNRIKALTNNLEKEYLKCSKLDTYK